MKRPRSNVALADRIGAAVAARSIIAHLFDGAISPPQAPWTIIGALQQPHVDRAAVRRSLDELLELRVRWSAFIRLDIARIEQLLALPPDSRSAAALAAHEAGGESWHAYVKACRAAAAVEIPAEVSTAGDAGAATLA